MQAVKLTGRPPFSTIFHGFVKLYRQRGLWSLYRVLWPNMTRTAVLASSHIATYDQVKAWLKSTMGMTEGLKLHLSTSMVAG